MPGCGERSSSLGYQCKVVTLLVEARCGDVRVKIPKDRVNPQATGVKVSCINLIMAIQARLHSASQRSLRYGSAVHMVLLA